MAYSETTSKVRPKITALYQLELDGPKESFWVGMVNLSGTSSSLDEIIRDIPSPIKEANEDLQAILTSEVGTFTVSETVTGDQGGSGTVVAAPGGTLTYTVITKFHRGENITGGTSGATATIDSGGQTLKSPATFNQDILTFGQLSDLANPAPGDAGGVASADLDEAFPKAGIPTPDGDCFFYIKDAQTAKPTLSVLQESVGGADGIVDFIPYRMVKNAGAVDPEDTGDVEDIKLVNFYGIMTNSLGMLLRLGRKVDRNGKIRPAIAPFIPNDTAIQDDTTDPTNPAAVHGTEATPPAVLDVAPTAKFAITKVRSLAVYQGSVVYGGFHSWNPQAAAADVGLVDQSNWAVFSAPAGSNFGPYEVAGGTTLRIGDTTAEPITKVVTNAIATDSLGVKGQLIFFTPKKVSIYDGLPPIPADPSNTNFQSVGLDRIGCAAPHSVVRTPFGVFFLGTDGMVYFMPIQYPMPPRPVGRAIEPDLTQLSLYQHRGVWATFFDNHYMISIPGHPLRSHNTVEWWADLRRLNPSEEDFGVRWYGPHTREIQVYARGRQGSSKEILLGSTWDGQVWQLHNKKVGYDPRVRDIAEEEEGIETGNVPIKPIAELNHEDSGSPHESKTYLKIRAGIGVTADADVTMEATITAADDLSGTLSTLQETFTETVQVTKGEFGTVQFGEDPLAPNEGYELVEKYFSQRMRGRAIKLKFSVVSNASASADPRIKIQNIEIVGKMTDGR